MKKASAGILYFFALTLCLGALSKSQDALPYFNYNAYFIFVFLASGAFMFFKELLTLAIPISVSVIAPGVAPLIMSYNSQMVPIEILLSAAASASGVVTALLLRAIIRLTKCRRN